MDFIANKEELQSLGYSILSAIYTSDEVDDILELLKSPSDNGDSVLKTKDLFAIRQLTNTINSFINGQAFE